MFTQTLHQWSTDFTILSVDPHKKEQHVVNLLKTMTPNILLTQLSKNEANVELTSILLQVIKCTFSTSSGRSAWLNQTSILPLLIEGCMSNNFNIASTCSQILQGIFTNRTTDKTNFLEMLKNKNDLKILFQNVVKLLTSNNAEVYTCASNIILSISTRLSESNQQELLVLSVYKLWKQCKETNPTGSYRALDLLAKISNKVISYFDYVVNTGCWEELDDFMNANVDDTLLQMSILETLVMYVKESFPACTIIANEEIFNTSLDVVGTSR